MFYFKNFQSQKAIVNQKIIIRLYVLYQLIIIGRYPILGTNNLFRCDMYYITLFKNYTILHLSNP